MTTAEKQAADKCAGFEFSELSIIIVTHNSAKVIERCLLAIGRNLHANLIVVDNNSTDETLDLLNRYSLEVMPMSENIGFGQAVNKAAGSAGTKYLCFLNPDCEPHKDYFSQGLAALKQHPLCCAAPRLIGRNGQEISGVQPGYTSLKLISDTLLTNYNTHRFCRLLEKLHGFHADDWNWPHGAAFFIGRELFLGLGGFSPRYFMYMEDVVFGRDLNRKGGRVISFEARLTHHEGEGASVSRKIRRNLLNDARCRYARDYYGRRLTLFMKTLALPATLLNQIRDRL